MLENLELIGTGFAIVMLVLAALWGACELIGLFFARAAKRAARKTAAATQASQAADDGIPPHHLAAIAAAVAHELGSGYRITHVAAPPHLVDGWPMEGRIETFAAHRIRTNWGPTRPLPGDATRDTLRGRT
ncbi:hypothetical protein RGUI_1053 [Rhodovulum sp. P5]|uniref:OadG family transporter subunit n=1 Tax=Rhodovulum sp. P5 TaxID=1564506 RepID=UPI0009C2B53F|nr:OadG family transporter subunit [Rhodovulum sp. P5]ARE39194.1 hypothetical protein RGUI_1053 [Rhodovulum sp. P5]